MLITKERVHLLAIRALRLEEWKPSIEAHTLIEVLAQSPRHHKAVVPEHQASYNANHVVRMQRECQICLDARVGSSESDQAVLPGFSKLAKADDAEAN